jgi:hypothetical protein
VSWSKPSFVGFNSPTASDGLFLSITLVLPVKMEYVYKRLPLTYLKHLLYDMESIINSANQYARDIERIDADSNTDSTDTSGLTRKERKEIKKTRLDKIHQTKEGALNKLKTAQVFQVLKRLYSFQGMI